MVDDEQAVVAPPVALEVKRSSGIGSSDIASILGLDQFRSAYDTWLVKTGRISTDVDNAPMYWGRRLQKTVIEEYELRRKVLLVHMFDEPIRHPERPWQIASPDATLPSESLVVEAKTTRYGKKYGPAGTDEVPDSHRLQVAWQLSTLDYEHGHIAALIGGQDFRIYEFRRDRELEDAILTRAEKWWRVHVVQDMPPEVSDSEMTRDYLRAMFPRELAPLRPATEAEAVLVNQYAAAVRQQAHVEKIVGDLDIKIRAAIGSDEGLEAQDFRLTYRKAKDGKKVDWEAAAKRMHLSLALIAGATLIEGGTTLTEVHQAAMEASAAIDEFTTVKPGSRRLLKAGAIFNGEEEK